jgi:hypothetical protein
MSGRDLSSEKFFPARWDRKRGKAIGGATDMPSGAL